MAVGGDTSHRSPQARQCLEEELAGLRKREYLLWVDEQINEIVVRLAGSEPLRDAADLPDGTVVTLRFEERHRDSSLGTRRLGTGRATPSPTPPRRAELTPPCSMCAHPPAGERACPQGPNTDVDFDPSGSRTEWR
jgi:hypothetical protein